MDIEDSIIHGRLKFSGKVLLISFSNMAGTFSGSEIYITCVGEVNS